MKKNKTWKSLVCAMAALSLGISDAVAQIPRHTSKPDSVYLLAYTTNRDNHHLGLHFAYSINADTWFSVGDQRSFLKCDYGTWGAQKRMLTPWVMQDEKGIWHCVWSVNETHKVFAHSASPNLTDWYRQSYPEVEGNEGCALPVMTNVGNGKYMVTYRSGGNHYRTFTTDFKQWTKAEPCDGYPCETYRKALVNGQEVDGQVQRVAWPVVEQLLRYHNHRLIKDQENAEQVMIPSLENLPAQEVTLTLGDVQKAKAISTELIGIFFEDINYAADGGIYAELVQNRDFEYDPEDTKGRWGWGHTYAWSLLNKSEGDELTIQTGYPIHDNNKHYAILKANNQGVALSNAGYDGIVVKKGDKYDLSLFTHRMNGKSVKFSVRLVNERGEVLAEKRLSASSDNWKKQKATLVPNADAEKASLQLMPLEAGSIALDMVSLFPQKTFKGRKNGLRPDLAQALADLKPRFVRFPGGCVSHGDGIDNIYRWVNTIGPLEARKPMRNIWNYHQSMGLGFYEYFQFCEDIGAQPLPVLAAGVPCQNSSTGGAGQQGGIPMEEMDEYVEEILHLIEWANGDPKKSEWAKLRAEAGHPKPFNLKYLGIGNEDLITDVFEERFKMIYDAVREKYPDIVVVGTVGPFYEGSDYEEGWDLATRYQVPMVDEHYYNTPGWFLNNQDYYDRYDRTKSKVYLGEYATHIHHRATNIQTALVDALHLTNVERNGDVVAMTSYAPLLAKEGHTQWNPDLIYFNNTEVKPTVEYFVQQLFSLNAGTHYLPSTLTGKELHRKDIRKRISHSVVRDEATGETIIKIVNLLPAEVKTDIDLSSLETLTSNEAKVTLLAGKDINDTKARPVNEKTQIDGKRMNRTLPPYSLTVIRVK